MKTETKMTSPLKKDLVQKTAAWALFASIFITPVTFAQTVWKPDRPVTLVVPYAPGGGTDATARAVSKRLSTLWGQPVLVENLPGADGLIGTRRVMDAKPDGYTLLLQVPAVVLTKYVPGLKGIDPLAKLDAVSILAQAPSAVVVSAKLGVKTLAELIQYCRTNATPCSLGTGESSAKIRAKQFASETGINNLIVVSYRGTGPIVVDLISGVVSMSFTGINSVLPHHKAGTVRIVATQGEKRAAALPDVPTTMEAGFPFIQSVTWFGMFAPKGTPQPVLQGIVSALREAGKDVDVQRAIAAAGAEPVMSSPAEFSLQIKQEDKRLGEIVKRFPFD
jgi:tripartite-type tricarboxylate transporter receptor subunit TctC